MIRGEVLRRTCFYINKRITQARRSFHIYNILDILSLYLQLDGGILWIYNIYNLSPGISSPVDRRKTLRIFLKTLAKESRYILLEDFNLYHPLWCSVKNLLYYVENDELAGFIRYINLELALS